MSKEMAGEIVKLLKSQFTRSFPEAGMKLIWQDLVTADDAALSGAYDYFVLNNRFPSPQQLKDQVIAEAKKIATAASIRRESEWGQKKEKRDEGTRLELSARDEHAKYAVMGIKMMSRDDKTRAEKLEFFRSMEERYPGVGWGAEGARLKGFWEEGKRINPF